MKEKTVKAKLDFLEVLGSLKASGSISKACEVIGWSRQTIYDWRRNDKAFDDAVVECSLEGKSILADLAESALIDRIKTGDTTAIIFTLKSLRKEFYGEKDERKEIEKAFSGEDGGDGLGRFKTTQDALIMTKLLIGNNKYKAKRQELLSPALGEMFDELEKITQKYEEVLR